MIGSGYKWVCSKLGMKAGYCSMGYEMGMKKMSNTGYDWVWV